MIVTKRREEIPHPNKWEGVEAGSKMRTSKGKRTFVILEITVRRGRTEPHALSVGVFAVSCLVCDRIGMRLPVLRCAALCRAVPCCAALCCAVLRCAVLRCAVVWCGVVWCAALCCAVLWCAVVCCGVLWCGVLRCAALWCGVVCCAVLCCAALGGLRRRRMSRSMVALSHLHISTEKCKSNRRRFTNTGSRLQRESSESTCVCR
jgi:hypothetical protein